MKKNFLLLLGSILFVLIALEILLRILLPKDPGLVSASRQKWVKVPERVWTEHHPQLGWYHQKNKQAILSVHNEDIPIRINSRGFRGSKEYLEQKPKGKHRIIALGDSFVFGFGVHDDQTFSARLESDHSGLEVLNLGVPGYGIDQILLAFRILGKDLNADNVLIGIFPEQFWRATRAFADSGHAKPYFSLSSDGKLVMHNVPVPPPYTLRENQYPDLINYSRLETILRKSVLYRFAKKQCLRLGKNLGWLDPDQTLEWRVGQVILRQLIHEIRQTGANPIVLIIPPERWLRSQEKSSLRKSLLRFCKREAVDFMDLSPGFFEAVQKRKLTDYYIEDDWHWTSEGHELASVIIARYLKGLGVLAS